MKTKIIDAFIWITIVLVISGFIYGVISLTAMIRSAGLEAATGSLMLFAVLIWGCIKLYKNVSGQN